MIKQITLADYIEQEEREMMLRAQMHALLEENQTLHAENKKLREELNEKTKTNS
jgi:regulator of replication initiation timing